MMKKLVDSSVQILRTITDRGTAAEWGKVFAGCEPVLTDYVLMEYRKTVIRALNHLADLVDEIGIINGRTMDEGSLMLRLGEVMEEVSVYPPRYYTARERTLLMAVIGYFQRHPQEFLRTWSPEELGDYIRWWALDLETHAFFVFAYGEHIENCKDEGNYLTAFKCPLAVQNGLYRCRKGTLECRISDILSSSAYRRAVEPILMRTTDVYTDLLETISALVEGEVKDGKSVGQKRCFKVSDTFHVSMCLHRLLGLLTADKAMATLAEVLEVDVGHVQVKDGRVVLR